MGISKNTLEIADVTDAAFKASLKDPALFIELVRAVIPELKGMGDDDIRKRLDLEDNLVMGMDKESSTKFFVGSDPTRFTFH